jgi:hypothetical protein
VKSLRESRPLSANGARTKWCCGRVKLTESSSHLSADLALGTSVGKSVII